MSSCKVAGTESLVSGLDRAVQGQHVAEITDNVKNLLADLIADGKVNLPDEICAPRDDCYARRRLHQSEEFGYEAIAMIWGPGQGTPLHDHAGVWCVEAVLEGEIEVLQYDLIEKKGDDYRFEAQIPIQAHVGMSGSLIPPFEYHTISNRLPKSCAITIHVYGRGMDHCHVFEPRGNGWYRGRLKQLVCHE